MGEEGLQPLFVHRQAIVADVEVLDALAVLTDALHELGELPSVDVDSL